MTIKVNEALKSQYVNDVQVQVPPSPQGIPTYIGRGISFGKLSRVPMCSIQDAGKTLYAQCYSFQSNKVFHFKYGMHASSSPKSNFIIYQFSGLGFDTRTHTKTFFLPKLRSFD